MPLARNVQPEILDQLPAGDPRACRSRKDLRRVNRIMGQLLILSRSLQLLETLPAPRRIVELGAGDGTFMLRLAQHWAQRWQSVSLTLVDRHDLVEPVTVDAFRRLGWQVDVAVADVFDWLAHPAAAEIDLITTNLFLHHFTSDRLTVLLARVAQRARSFVACEPRRTTPALMASRLLVLVGCSAVTRHDAVVSVRAGFCGQELSSLWPADGRWRLREWPAGLFSHAFLAHAEGS